MAKAKVNGLLITFMVFTILFLLIVGVSAILAAINGKAAQAALAVAGKDEEAMEMDRAHLFSTYAAAGALGVSVLMIVFMVWYILDKRDASRC